MIEIKLARIKAGLSQAELAQMTGIDQSQISRMERGLSGVTVDQLINIAEAIGIPAASLLSKVPGSQRVA